MRELSQIALTNTRKHRLDMRKLINHLKLNEKNKVQLFIDNVNGRVAVPILLYFLGVPGVVVILLWAFFFRGK